MLMCVLDTDVAIHFITQYICDLFPLFEIQQKKEIISEKKKKFFTFCQRSDRRDSTAWFKGSLSFWEVPVEAYCLFSWFSMCFKVLKAPCLVSRFPICFGGYPFDSCWRVWLVSRVFGLEVPPIRLIWQMSLRGNLRIWVIAKSPLPLLVRVWWIVITIFFG